MPRIVTRPVIASIASITRLSWRSVVGSRHWLKHATTSIMSGSIMSGIGGCSSCRVGVGCPYSTQCSAALPHRHFGEGIEETHRIFKQLAVFASTVHLPNKTRRPLHQDHGPSLGGVWGYVLVDSRVQLIPFNELLQKLVG